jgi:hypothetical protein
VYLAEAHKHEKKQPLDLAAMPGKDVPIDDDFLRANQHLILLIASAMFEALRQYPNALDADVADALDSLARTWRSFSSGIYYEATPVNPIAGEIFEAVKARVDYIRTRMKEAGAAHALRDAVVLGVLVFLQRLAAGMNNGRSKCKAFVVFLSDFCLEMKSDLEASLADQPRVVL